jgi:phosphoribosylanthranilate isomerase
MRIQIYEIQTPSEADMLIELGVDHIGSVVADAARWRQPMLRDTVALVRRSAALSSLIPLYLDLDAIRRTLDYYRPDIVHFCDTLTDPRGKAADCGKLLQIQATVRENYPGIRVMRSIPIARPGLSDRVPTLELAARFQPISDFFLTDTLLLSRSAGGNGAPLQPVDGFIGITGQTCDWTMARRLVELSRIPVFLAGGVSPDNVADGIRRVGPAGVDSCTATNAVDGGGRPIRFRKDPLKVRRFIERARRGCHAAATTQRTNHRNERFQKP